jgi:hypothetical protein
LQAEKEIAPKCLRECLLWAEILRFFNEIFINKIYFKVYIQKDGDMMAQKTKHISKDEPEDELLPHKEIEELKDELRKLKEFEITPTKKLRISLIELNKKLDKLLNIFDEARHEIRTEEIGLGFKEKMKPVIEKMDRMLEQQADIAEGMVALADIVKGRKEEPEEEEEPSLGPPVSRIATPGPRPMEPPRPGMPPPRMPPRPGVPPPGVNIRPAGPRAPPKPPRKKRFGII